MITEVSTLELWTEISLNKTNLRGQDLTAAEKSEMEQLIVMVMAIAPTIDTDPEVEKDLTGTGMYVLYMYFSISYIYLPLDHIIHCK